MTINWWGNWSINLFIKISFFWKLNKLLFCELVLFTWCDCTCAYDTVGLDFSGKQRETLFDIQWHVISVFVNSCNFNFLSWFNRVNIVTQQNYFFTSWNSTGKNFWWWLLYSDFLIISIHSFFLHLFERSSWLAWHTLTMLDIFWVICVNGIFYMPTLFTSEINNFQLVENFTSDRNDSSNFDKFAQMYESKLSDVIHNRKLLDSDKHLREDVWIRLVTIDCHSVGDLIKFRQNYFWLQPYPHGNNRQCRFQMCVAYHEWLLVINTHVIYLIDIDRKVMIALKWSQKLFKLLADVF